MGRTTGLIDVENRQSLTPVADGSLPAQLAARHCNGWGVPTYNPPPEPQAKDIALSSVHGDE